MEYSFLSSCLTVSILIIVLIYRLYMLEAGVSSAVKVLFSVVAIFTAIYAYPAFYIYGYVYIVLIDIVIITACFAASFKSLDIFEK